MVSVPHLIGQVRAGGSDTLAILCTRTHKSLLCPSGSPNLAPMIWAFKVNSLWFSLHQWTIAWVLVLSALLRSGSVGLMLWSLPLESSTPPTLPNLAIIPSLTLHCLHNKIWMNIDLFYLVIPCFLFYIVIPYHLLIKAFFSQQCSRLDMHHGTISLM